MTRLEQLQQRIVYIRAAMRYLDKDNKRRARERIRDLQREIKHKQKEAEK